VTDPTLLLNGCPPAHGWPELTPGPFSQSRWLFGKRQQPQQLGETLALEADTYLFIQYKTAKGRLYYLVSRIFFASV